MRLLSLAALIIAASLHPLNAQIEPSSAHVDERALDSLKDEKAKWWAKVQAIMRDHSNQPLRVETARYLLSRPFVWQEGHPRDSETRTATLMLAAEIREAIAPLLKVTPVDDGKIFASEEYRAALLKALNQALPSAKTPHKQL
jgi:hypothetical protein